MISMSRPRENDGVLPEVHDHGRCIADQRSLRPVACVNTTLVADLHQCPRTTDTPLPAIQAL